MPNTKGQNFQDVQQGNLNINELSSRTDTETVLNSFDNNMNNPMRMSVSDPPDAKINFEQQEIQLTSGKGKSIPPILGQVPDFPISSINFQTKATTGGTFDITFPGSTVGQFRRVGYTLLSTGTVKAIFSAENVALGGLANPGTLFDSNGLPIGWIDLECTNATGLFKTAGSVTDIIENSVGGDARIVVISSFGGGGGGTSASGANGVIQLSDGVGNLISDAGFIYNTVNKTLILVGSGANANHTLFSRRASGENFSEMSSASLANNNIVEQLVSAFATTGNNFRSGSMFMINHAGISHAHPAIKLQDQAGAIYYYWVDNGGILRFSNTITAVGTTIGTPVSASLQFATIWDQKGFNVSGGAFAKDDWRTRDLNNLIDPNSFVTSIAGNQIRLITGTYFLWATSAAYRVDVHRLRLRNITTPSTLVEGTTHYASGADATSTNAFVIGEFTVADGNQFLELQHICQTSDLTRGFGHENTIAIDGVGIFSLLSIQKLS